ncbi:hypothetical protein [Candidatus Poriferisocius sp.]|uniref:hypothetical protein n=1 Tax=Candidatus Poriferisocius sp. TaxID=3101276 RepID=UPI003B027F39
MAKIVVDGEAYPVVESLGFEHTAGMYAKLVKVGDGEKMAVKAPRGAWRFWTAEDRVKPLREEAVCGTPYVRRKR